MNKLFTLSLLLSSLLIANEMVTTELPATHIKNIEVNQTTYFSYDEALELARKNHKIIMIKLTAQHCHFCKKMDREVMVEKEVVTALKKDFVSVEIDVDNDKIPLDLNPTMTPTFIFVTEDEKIMAKIPGSWGKEDFLDFLKSAVEKSKEEKSKKEKGEAL